MQVVIDVPDNVPPSIIQQSIRAFKEKLMQLQNEDELKIDENLCLATLTKIEQGDFSGFSEITDIKAHIQSLKNEVN